MRSNLGRFHRPMSRGLVNNMLTMNNLGDGSTLSLDFTTMGGVLDPRLTFSRASTATFVNSSGYVEYAGANTAPYSESLNVGLGYSDNAILSRSTTTSPTGNTAVVFYPTIVLDYHRLQFGSPVAMVGATTVSVYVKQIGSDYRVGINATGYIAASVICSLIGAGSVVGAVGGTAPNRAATITKVTDDGWYRITLTGTYNTISSVYVFMASATSTDSTGLNFVGVASQGVSFWGFQVNPGSTAQTYYPTTGATLYHAPRFDYSPTNIGEPRGLLIESSATNLLNWSETFATTGGTNNNWADTNLTRTSTNNTSPRNDATALRITASAGNGTIISSAAIGTSASRTLSVWLRRVTGTGNIQYTLDNGTNWTTQVITSSWVRYSFAATTADQRVGFRIVTSGDAIEVWGAQLELGSGASSLIPTGASQVTRNADYCQSTVASGIAGWLTSLTTSTYFVDFVPQTQRGLFSNAWRTITSTSQGYEIYCFDGTAGVNLTCTTKITASTNVENNIASGLALNSRHKLAYSIDATSGLRSVNGSTVSAANPVALPTGTVSVFGVGSSGLGTGTSINAWIRSIKYYPTALTQAQINTLTTP